MQLALFGMIWNRAWRVFTEDLLCLEVGQIYSAALIVKPDHKQVCNGHYFKHQSGLVLEQK